MSTPTKRSDRIPEFESLRAFMAWWVVVEHVRILSPVGLPKSVSNLIWAGHAVDVFIMLSGFVIFLLLDAKHETFKSFIVRRVFRLWPVFLICFAWAMVLTGFGSGGDWKVILFSNLTLFHGVIPESWCPGVTTTVLAPSWSISLEWQFYLIAPLLVLLLRNRLWLFFALLTVDAILYQILRDSKEFIYPSFLPLRLHLFVLGGFSYFLWKHAPTTPTAARLPLAFSFAGMAFLLTRSTSLMIWAGVFGYVVLKRMATGSEEGSPAFCQRFTRWLGTISYSTYLCHWPLIFMTEKTLKATGPISGHPILNFAAVLVIVAVLTLLASWLLHIAVEKPGMDYGRRLAGRLAPKPVAATPTVVA